MKLGLSLQGINDTIKNLNDVGIAINKDFSGELYNNLIEIRDKAKEILQGKVNPIYSTGKLRDSIEVNMLDKNRGTVGPDMRVAVNKKGESYAEWVEFGHWMTGGFVKKGTPVKVLKTKGAWWWEGHHYMEGAWLDVSPKIIPDIAKTLRETLNSFSRIKGKKQLRNINTEQFTKGKSLIIT